MVSERPKSEPSVLLGSFSFVSLSKYNYVGIQDPGSVLLAQLTTLRG